MISNEERIALQGAIQQLKDYITGMPGIRPPSNCINCKSFNEDSEKCALYNARPPARTIVEGCPEWDLDIPF